MASPVISKPYGFISRDGKTRIYAKVWTTQPWEDAADAAAATITNTASADAAAASELDSDAASINTMDSDAEIEGSAHADTANVEASLEDASTMAAASTQRVARHAPGALKKSSRTQPIGIVQLVHGMAEHIERYEHLARYLVKQGFLVCAEDHIGHGHSARTRDELGHMPLREGKEILIEDVHTLYCKAHRRYPDIPYIMYGHSMGSLITRCYIERYGEDLSACVLSGTANGPLFASYAGEVLAHLIATTLGEQHKSRLLDSLGAGSFARSVKNARTPFDWISTDDSVVDAFMADELSGQMFSAGGYATLLSLLIEVASPAWVDKIPQNLPLLFIAGTEDPVGQMGRGVKRVVSLLEERGHQAIEMRLYDGVRHELHNEPIREEVYAYVADWLLKTISKEAK